MTPGPGAAEATTSDTLGDVVARLRRAMRRSARVRMPSTRLSVAQLELLSIVEEYPGSRSGQLAQLLRLAPNSVSTLVGTLAEMGMLERSSDPADKRAVTYSLTVEGAREVIQWRETSNASLKAAVAALDPDELRVMGLALPVLDRIVALLDEQTDRYGAP